MLSYVLASFPSFQFLLTKEIFVASYTFVKRGFLRAHINKTENCKPWMAFPLKVLMIMLHKTNLCIRMAQKIVMFLDDFISS